MITRIKLFFLVVFLSTLVVVVVVVVGDDDDVNLLSFYTVNYSTDVPGINGHMDDKCWSLAENYKTYYVYFKSSPEQGKLKTTLRMLWNEKGIYLGIVNYEENMLSIRTNYTIRDDNHLWQDDSAELYFDPSGDGIGFTKFIVNAIGTVADMRRIDAAVSQPEWSAAGAEVVTSKDENAWYIEAFFPWSDLGQRAEAKDIWRFCHVRYAWSSGSFVGISSSLGGSYARPENFGFIYFNKNDHPKVKEVGKALMGMATQPWTLPIKNGLLVLNNGEPEFIELSDLYENNYNTSQNLLKEIGKISDNSEDAEITDLKQRLEQLYISDKADIDIVKLRVIRDIRGELDELYWKQKLQELMNGENK